MGIPFPAMPAEMRRAVDSCVAQFETKRSAFALLGGRAKAAVKQKPRWAFLHVPKTAGTMIDHVFTGYLLAHGHEVSTMLVKGINRDPGLRKVAPADFLACDRSELRATLDRRQFAYVSQHLHGDAIRAFGADYLRFTVLRDPYDRFASEFMFRLQRSRRPGWTENELKRLAHALLEERRNIYCRTFAWDVPHDEAHLPTIVDQVNERLDCVFVQEDLKTALTVLLNQFAPAAVWVTSTYNDTRGSPQRDAMDAFLDREVRSVFVDENACDRLLYEHFCRQNTALSNELGPREAEQVFLAPPANFMPAGNGTVGVLTPRIGAAEAIAAGGSPEHYFDFSTVSLSRAAT